MTRKHEELFSHRNKLCKCFKMTPQQFQDNKIREFEDRFYPLPSGSGDFVGEYPVPSRTDLTDFLRTALADQRKLIADWARESKPNTLPLGDGSGDSEKYFIFGYNQSLQDLLGWLGERGD